MDKVEHTPLPWAIKDIGDMQILTSVEAGKRGICSTGGYSDNRDHSAHDESEANAAYIVKACNAFPELVGALKEAISELEEATVCCLGEDYNNPKFNDILEKLGER